MIRYHSGERNSAPPYPENYFTPKALALLESYNPKTATPEQIQSFTIDIGLALENTWTDSARSILATWIGLIYQTTNLDRKKQFMDNINPQNPLGL